MKHRVCIATNEFRPLTGGVGVSVDRISKLLNKAGYEVHIVFFDFDGRSLSGQQSGLMQHVPRVITQEIGCDRVLHTIVPAKEINEPNPAQIQQQFFTHLYLLQESYSFSLFHSFYISSTGFITGLVAKQAGVPFIASIRGNDLHLQSFSQRLSQIRWVLENADIVTCVTDELARLAAQIATRTGPVLVIHNSIDPSAFAQLVDPKGYSKLPRPVIGSSGVFKRKKGIEYFLQACLDLREEQREFSVVLVGSPLESEGNYWQTIFNEVSEKLSILVTGLVPHHQMLGALAGLDLYVASSINDGFPNAVLEAMLAGVPIIATKSGAMREILVDGKDAIMVEPCSSIALSQGIRSLLDDTDLRTHIAKSAHDRVLTEFSPAYEQQAWSQCYSRVLGNA